MQSTKVPCNFFTGTAVLVVIRIVNERPAVLFLDFYAILIFIDLTKNSIGGILKEMEMPEHWVISTLW